MGRRRKHDSTEGLARLIFSIVGLVGAAFVFVPGFRLLAFSTILTASLVLGTALVGLIAWAVYRHHRKKKDEEYASVYLAPGIGKVPNGNRTPGKSISNLPEVDSEDDLDPLSQSQPPSRFSRELLDVLEWRRLELLVTWYFQKIGFDAKRSRVGPDGGVDILVSNVGEDQPTAYVQCKAWHTYNVGIKPIRELFGVMASEGIQTGYFVTSGGFTEEASRFAQGKQMTLVNGTDLIARVNDLSEADLSDILDQLTRGDYTTPTCSRCDVKLVRREGPKGDFWGCPNFSKRPSCRQTLQIRRA